jgi:hypothetical protein
VVEWCEGGLVFPTALARHGRLTGTLPRLGALDPRALWRPLKGQQVILRHKEGRHAADDDRSFFDDLCEER